MLQANADVQLVVYGGIVFVAVSMTAILAVLLARPASRGVAVGVGLGLAAWLAAASALAQVGFLGEGDPTPSFAAFGLRFAVPLVLGAIAFAAFEPLRRAALDPELQPSLVAIQTFRVIGVLPLVLVPTFLVPLATVLHLVSLRALARARETARAYS